jgi:hypothetical protein
MNAAPSRTTKTDDTPGEFEGEIREFVRRDVAQLRRPASAGEPTGEQAVHNLNSLLDRVSVSSVTEIDNLIADLRNVRDFLQNEGERVQREISSYAQLSHVAMTSVKIVAESMAQWKAQVSDTKIDRS